MSKTILQLDHKDAKEFFLREESYTSVKLPSYIKFSPLIEKISAKLDENLQGDKKICRKNEKVSVFILFIREKIIKVIKIIMSVFILVIMKM
ncbi:hypothetical protein BSPWISOXPB_4380 [uncultured Gammaproteobacteria bacterium]|nr:hypothetical protein BSPWISOXPB_4380 [uncultured Gammaproteobacteria bacterium]